MKSSKVSLINCEVLPKRAQVIYKHEHDHKHYNKSKIIFDSVYM